MSKIPFYNFSFCKWLCCAVLLALQSCVPNESNEKKVATPSESSVVIKESVPVQGTDADTSGILGDDFLSACTCRRSITQPEIRYEVYFDKGFFLKSNIKLKETWQGCISRDFPVDTLNYWKKEERCLKVKSLALIGFNNISTEFEIFKNVEALLIAGQGDIDTIILHDIFPKLKFIDIREARLDVRKSNAWLKNIKYLNAFQAEIIGLKNFNQAPNLEQINLGIACFSPFPKDIEVLHCLKKIEIQTWGKDSIDLNQIDFSQMPCLLYAYFQTWSDAKTCTMVGIPKGIKNRTDINVYINHQRLTKQEKAILKDHMNARFKKHA